MWNRHSRGIARIGGPTWGYMSTYLTHIWSLYRRYALVVSKSSVYSCICSDVYSRSHWKGSERFQTYIMDVDPSHRYLHVPVYVSFALSYITWLAPTIVSIYLCVCFQLCYLIGAYLCIYLCDWLPDISPNWCLPFILYLCVLLPDMFIDTYLYIMCFASSCITWLTPTFIFTMCSAPSCFTWLMPTFYFLPVCFTSRYVYWYLPVYYVFCFQLYYLIDA